jgi:hypothetical protein
LGRILLAHSFKSSLINGANVRIFEGFSVNLHKIVYAS